MVVDASALMAFLRSEPGGEVVHNALLKMTLLLSSVNHTELKGKLVGQGVFTPHQVDVGLRNLGRALEVVPFDHAQSDLAAFWYARRNPYNLSLGDCACLALAEARGLPCVTAERAWADLPNLRVKLELIR